LAASVDRSIATARPQAWSGAVAYRWLAALIVALHIALTLGWSTVVPLGEGPDEQAHMRYVLFLVQTGRLPVQRAEAAESDVPGEGHQPPLAYWLYQPLARWLPPEERLLEIGANPEFRLFGGVEPNAFFRSTRDIWPYSGVGLAWHLARTVSALLGGITVLLTYLTARRCFPELRWLPLGAAAIVALNPQVIFAHALVSNDPLMIALTSGLLYASIRIVTLGHEAAPRAALVWTIVAGLLLGLALITKQSALAFVPLPALALLLRRAGIGRWLRDCALVLVLAALISGWWYLRNLRLYGDWLGLEAFQETFAPGGISQFTLWSWTGGFWNLLRSSWGVFGWVTLPMNDGAYWDRAVAAAGAAAAAGSDRAELSVVCAAAAAGHVRQQLRALRHRLEARRGAAERRNAARSLRRRHDHGDADLACAGADGKAAHGVSAPAGRAGPDRGGAQRAAAGRQVSDQRLGARRLDSRSQADCAGGRAAGNISA
jgi:hypothetical protein